MPTGRDQRRHKAPPDTQGRDENNDLAIFNPVENPVYFKHMLLVFFPTRRHALVQVFIILKNVFVKKHRRVVCMVIKCKWPTKF